MNGTIYMIGMIFSMISMGTTISVILLHFKYKKLRKHPGQYVLIQCFCQFFYDLHWCISFPGFNIYHRNINSACKVEALVLTTTFNLGLLYVTVLGVELSLKFKFKGSIAYFKRSLVYNLTCISIVTVIDLMLLFQGKYSLTEFHTCSISSYASDMLECIICLVSSCIMCFSLWYMMQNKNKNSVKVIKNFGFVIFFVILTWIFPSAISFFEAYFYETALKDTAYLLGTISGTFIGLSRIINYKVIRFFSKRVRNSSVRRSQIKTFSLETMNESLHDSFFSRAQSLDGLGEWYENVTVKTFIEIICSLSLFFYEKEEVYSKYLKQNSFKPFCQDPKPSRANFKYNVHKSKVILVEYEAEAFEMLRKAYSHDSRDIYEYLINRSISDQTNHDLLQSNLIMNTSNGSMIFITSDQKYVIKVISKHDKSVFVEVLLEKYINRLIFNPESKLVRILGLFQIKPSRIYFLIMENTCILNDTCLRFDLKGSKVDRLVSESSSNKTILKDQNFLKSKIKVSLPINEYKNMIKTLTEDFKLLKTLGIMDYSIYLVYYTDSIQTLYPHYTVNNISIAVIDLFQLYDSQKALERWWKIYVRCHQRHNLSSVSSQEYFLRIQEFLTQIFEVSKIN